MYPRAICPSRQIVLLTRFVIIVAMLGAIASTIAYDKGASGANATVRKRSITDISNHTPTLLPREGEKGIGRAKRT
jgi:hypothetical protein